LAFPLILAAAAATFYVTFSSPSIGWRDGPEFTVTSVYLDIGHPSGFPTYSILAKIFTWIPLGSIGFRVTLFTALMGAASLFLAALLLKLLHSRGTEPSALPWLLSPLFLYALDQAVFVSSTELEVYSLNTAFLLLLLYCASRWNSGDGVAWLYAGGFLYGVSCGNHAAMSLYLPVLLLLTFWGEPASETVTGPKRHLVRIGLLALFFLAGLSIYLYLIVRSMTDHLPIDFGRTNTLKRLWMHISDAKDAEFHFQGFIKFGDIVYLAPVQFRNLCSPLLFFLSVPFFLWGLRHLWKRFQILSVSLPVLILINAFFFYYWIDGASAFLPAITAWVLPVCLGLGELGRALRSRRILRPVTASVTAAVIAVSSVLMAIERMDESDAVSGFQSTELYFPDLALMPPESLAVHDNGWFPLASLQYAYSVRPDVSMVLLTGLFFPDLVAMPEPYRMPHAVFPVKPDGNFMSPFEEGFPDAFFSANVKAGRRIFFMYGQMSGPYMPYLLPDDRYMWLAELRQDYQAGIGAIENGLYDRFLERSEAYWERLASGADGPPARKVPTYMYYSVFTVLEYLYANERYLEVTKAIGSFLRIFGNPSSRTFIPYDVYLNFLALRADSFRKAGDDRAALAVLQELISFRPNYPANYLMLGYIHDNLGDGAQTLAAWNQGLKQDPLDYRLIVRYGMALAKYRSLSESHAFLSSKVPLLLKNGMYAEAALISHERDCLLIPPSQPDLNDRLPGPSNPGTEVGP
jgi:tetratricopeptide (TPR) repeat protein